MPEPVEDLVDPLAGEQPHEVVLGGQEEARLAGVALAAGAAAQLVVDPPRLVALGAEDEQAAGVEHLLAAARRPCSRIVGQHLLVVLVVVGVAGRQPELGHLELGQVLLVAAELDVDAAAGHVGRDRDRARRARLGDRLALALGVLGLGVQHGVLDSLALELVGQQLGDLDRDRADQHRLALLVAASISLTTADHLPSLVL